jgi:hypothetical protein
MSIALPSHWTSAGGIYEVIIRLSLERGRARKTAQRPVSFESGAPLSESRRYASCVLPFQTRTSHRSDAYANTGDHLRTGQVVGDMPGYCRTLDASLPANGGSTSAQTYDWDDVCSVAHARRSSQAAIIAGYGANESRA